MNPEITPAAKALAEQFPWGCKVYPATAERLIQDAFNAERKAAAAQAKEENANLRQLIGKLNPSVLWDMARQYYTGTQQSDQNPCISWHRLICKEYDKFLAQQPNQTGGEREIPS